MRSSARRRAYAVGVAALTLGLLSPTAPATADDAPDRLPADSQVLSPTAWIQYYFGQGFDRRALTAPFRTSVKWSSGAMPIGYGSPLVETALRWAGDTRPVTAYFIGGFDARPDPSRWRAVRLTFPADDGVALYIDGREVTRVNLPQGALTDGTWATAAPSTRTAMAEPVVLDLPLSVLTAKGTWHSLTAEVHANHRSSRDLSFQVGVDMIPNTSAAFVPTGSVWNYRYDGSYYWPDRTVPTDWASTGRLGLGSGTGASPLGFGTPTVATDLDVTPVSARPLTAYFSLERTVPDAQKGKDLQVTTWANDGLVVYVNGQEAARGNMPPGPVTFGTHATAAPRAALAARNPITFTIPAKELAGGSVLLAAEVHLNWKGTTDMTFDMDARFVPAG